MMMVMVMMVVIMMMMVRTDSIISSGVNIHLVKQKQDITSHNEGQIV